MHFGLSRKLQTINSRSLLCPAFELYVLPILMYLSSAWSPKLKRDIDSLEKVQRRYTKLICNLRKLPYKERLRELNAHSLSNRRIYADMIFIYKCLHDNINFPTCDFGLVLVASATKGCGCRLRQRIANIINQLTYLMCGLCPLGTDYLTAL